MTKKLDCTLDQTRKLKRQKPLYDVQKKPEMHHPLSSSVALSLLQMQRLCISYIDYRYWLLYKWVNSMTVNKSELQEPQAATRITQLLIYSTISKCHLSLMFQFMCQASSSANTLSSPWQSLYFHSAIHSMHCDCQCESFPSFYIFQ